MSDEALDAAAEAGARERDSYIETQGREPKSNAACDGDAPGFAIAWARAWLECKKAGAHGTQYDECQRTFYGALFGPGETTEIKWNPAARSG
jgi:hypothetical protein